MLYYDVPDAYDMFYTKGFRDETRLFYHKLFGHKRIREALDCSAGSGQMTMQLSELGFSVTACDVNRHMLKKAKQNFLERNLIADFVNCDFRNLKKSIKAEFDLVMSTGNSIGHVKNEEIETVIEQMDSVLKPGGTIYIDSRNWDLIMKRKQRFYLFNPIVRDKGRVNHVQVWDYNKDGSMIFNFLIFEEIENRIVSKRQFYVHYYPFSYTQIIEKLESMNYQHIRICKLGNIDETDIENIDWYTITAEKSIENI